MRGDTHALCGAAAGSLVGAASESMVVSVACVIVGGFTALGPDIDHPGSSATRGLGKLARRMWWKAGRARTGLGAGLVFGFAAVVLWLAGLIPRYVLCPVLRWCSEVLGFDAHRGLTHTVVFGVVFSAAIGGGSALFLPPVVAVLIAAAAAAGWLTALAGDWITMTSLPDMLWPFTTPLPPRRLRIRTGDWEERRIVLPAAVLATAAGLWLNLAL